MNEQAQTSPPEKIMQDQFILLSARVLALELQADRLKNIEGSISDLLETFNAFKGAWIVLDGIGKLAKPVTFLVSLGAGWFWLKDHIKEVLR